MNQFDREFHGGLYDRGTCDSWYGRPADPHWYPNGTYNGEAVTSQELSQAEIAEYMAGYLWNEEHGGRKKWD